MLPAPLNPISEPGGRGGHVTTRGACRCADSLQDGSLFDLHETAGEGDGFEMSASASVTTLAASDAASSSSSEIDVAIGEGDFELLDEFFLHRGKVVAGGDPRGNGGFLLGSEGHRMGGSELRVES